MPAFVCHDCALLHSQQVKRAGYPGYGTCGCTCARCGNQGRLICERCGATGKSGWLGRPCKECGGHRTIPCPDCKGFLGDPSCPVCRGTSCETCWGTRSADLEKTLAMLKESPRRYMFYPPGSYRSPYERDFPVFSFDGAWRRLSKLIDFDPVLTVCRGVPRECVQLTGRAGQSERSLYSIYRFGDDQYGIEESFTSFESEGTAPLQP